MKRIFPLVALALFGGCYSYTRAAAPPQAGTEIEVELTDAGSAELARLVGPNVVSIRGRVNEMSADTVGLAVASVLKRSGTDEYWSREPLAISRTHIASIATRKFSAARTGALALTAIGGALLLRSAIELAVDGGGGKGKLPGQ